jgi:triosephosphate isomerase
MDFICAGNWKMNKSPSEAATFVKQLRESATPEELGKIVLFPTALISATVAEAAKGSPLRWGGQNCFYVANGAFTGENSGQMLKDLGAKFCLVGHSERRHVLAEPDEMIAKKVQFLQSLDMIPVLCVGETMDDRRWNRTQEVVIRQARTGLQNADPDKPFWIAYEPVWAIGTGEVATPLQVEEAHGMLRTCLREWSAATADTVPLLYGGSVKSDNAKSLAALNNVNGFLIGGASLDPKELLNIARYSKEARGK